MKKSLLPIRFDFTLLSGIAVYLAATIILFPHFRYQMNPDGISYMSIAQKYLSADFSNALNGYWGPMISWLMVPLLAAGLTPLVSANFLLIIIGLTVVIQSWLLVKKLEIDPLLSPIVLCVTAIVVVFFVYRAISPDLLVASLTLALILKTMDSSLFGKKNAGIIFGLIGAGLYLTKSFGFPFFITYYIVICLIFYFRKDISGKRKTIIMNFITGIVVFLVLSGIWIILISNKYDQLILGTSGNYNRAITDLPAHPMFYAGLIAPPNSTAISIWEDVGTLNLEGWGIFDSRDTIIREVNVFFQMLRSIMKFLFEFSVLAIPVLLIIIGFLISRGKAILDERMFYPVLIMIINIGGYALIAVDPRYIWVSDILLLVMGIKLLDLYFNRESFNRILRAVITALFGFSFLITPVSETWLTKDSCKNIAEMSESLKDLNINGQTASYDDWSSSMYLSFLSGWQYFGVNGNFEELYIEEELIRNDIDYYMVWDTAACRLKFTDKYGEVTNGIAGGFKIYQIKP